MARVLVLGGTSFVGRAVVRAAQAHGHEVATLNRGMTGVDVPGVLALRADRDDAAGMSRVLAGCLFDAAVDVSARAPRHVRIAVGALRGAVDRYGLVSSMSVYRGDVFDGSGLIHEDAPTVVGDPDDESAPALSRYAEQKRGCELAALRGFDDGAVTIVRPSFILGPYENMGRIPYWLGRAAAGGVMIGPGSPDRSFPFVDVDDLAIWLVDRTLSGAGGVYNAANSPSRDTWGDWLTAVVAATGGVAQVRWIDDGTLLAAGVAPNFGLPMWIPGGLPDLATDAIGAPDSTGGRWWTRSTPPGSGGHPARRSRRRRIVPRPSRRLSNSRFWLRPPGSRGRRISRPTAGRSG